MRELIAVLAQAAAAMPGQNIVHWIEPVVGSYSVPAALPSVSVPAARPNAQRLPRHFGPPTPLRIVGGHGGVLGLPAILPGSGWIGRTRGFGALDGIGLTGTVVRARSTMMQGLQTSKHGAGFLASSLRYGIAMDGDDLLTFDLTASQQRLRAVADLGRGKPIHIRTLYLGAALVHDRRLDLAAGWYHVATSFLSPLDHAVEFAAGMPPAGQGMRLGLSYDLGRLAADPTRIGLELRSGTVESDRTLEPDRARRSEQRALLRVRTPF